MSRGTQAYIDLLALKYNFHRVRQIVGHQKILVMVKANGYGHGLLRVVNALKEEADAFGVACIEEALSLREAGITNTVVLMSGFLDQFELRALIENQIDAVVHQNLQIDILEKHLTQPVSVWLKVDTGMHRLGFMPSEVKAVHQRLMALSNVKKPIPIMTHLADADNINREFTYLQLRHFADITQNLVSPKSIANSAAILAYPESYADWVRPGIMLYGVSPFSNRTGLQEELKPVMTLISKLIAIKHLKKGDYVGYGCTWRCPEDMPTGVIAIGYGDGYPRHAQNGTPVLLNGKICPLVGRVSMDMITVDLRPQPNAQIGDKVTLWGNGLPIEKVAACANTIGYELLCDVTKRVKFVDSGD